MGSLKIDKEFRRTFFIVSAMVMLVVGTTICCAHRIPLKSQTPSSSCYPLPVSQTGVYLKKLAPVRQECPNWCWAATTAMLASYYDNPVRQCDLGAQRIAKTASASATFVDCCTTTGTAACSAKCNHGADHDTHELKMMLEEIGLAAQEMNQTPSEDELKSELSNGRPIIAHFSIPGIPTHHIAIINGFIPGNPALGTETVYILVDPDGGVRCKDAANYEVSLETYQELKSGPSGNLPWSGTFWHITPAGHPCRD